MTAGPAASALAPAGLPDVRRGVGAVQGRTSAGRGTRPRISWPGLVVSQAMVLFGAWLAAEWDVGLWWTIVCMSSDAGYAVTHLHPPYREPALHLAIGYGVWLMGMVAMKFGPRWL